MIVVDSSILVSALGNDGPVGDQTRDRLRGEQLTAPQIIDIEVVSAWRRLRLVDRRARTAITHLRVLPLDRVPHRPLLDRCWELRENLTIYDAAYVALAEILGVTLLTADRRLANAPGLRCPVEVLPS